MSPGFDLDEEYAKNKLFDLRQMLSKYGNNQYMTDFLHGRSMSLEIGNRSLGGLSNAILKYQRFIEATEHKGKKRKAK